MLPEPNSACPFNTVKPKGSVMFLYSEIKIKGWKKSFYRTSALVTNTTTIEGMHIGKIMLL